MKVPSGGLHLPFYRAALSLDLYGAYSDVDAGTSRTAVGDLQFNGRGRALGSRLGWILPRLADADLRLAVGLDQRTYLNQCGIQGLPEGACGSAGESVSVQPVTVELSMRGAGTVAWSASAAWSRNLQWGGRWSEDARFEAVRPGARPHYATWRLSGSLAAPMPADWQLLARASVQHTDDALVPGEQFGIGGASSVRGYEERELAGDRGVSVAVELASPTLPIPASYGLLQALLFADAGQVDNRLDTPCLEDRRRCTLAGMGVGWRWQREGWQARLAVAHALRDGATTGRHDTRAHLLVSASF